jgi:hypothetical protein
VRGIAAILAAVALHGCGDGATNFSQFPGFAEYSSAHPSAEPLTTADERALLERYRLRLLAGKQGPIRFCEVHAAEGPPTDGAGNAVSAAVTAEYLNRHKGDPRAVFEHVPSGRAGSLDWRSDSGAKRYAPHRASFSPARNERRTGCSPARGRPHSEAMKSTRTTARTLIAIAAGPGLLAACQTPIPTDPSLALACQTSPCECVSAVQLMGRRPATTEILWHANGDAYCPADFVLRRKKE